MLVRHRSNKAQVLAAQQPQVPTNSPRIEGAATAFARGRSALHDIGAASSGGTWYRELRFRCGPFRGSSTAWCAGSDAASMNYVSPRRLYQAACFSQALPSTQSMQAALTPGSFFPTQFGSSAGCTLAHKSLWFAQGEAVQDHQTLHTCDGRGLVCMCKGKRRQRPINYWSAGGKGATAYRGEAGHRRAKSEACQRIPHTWWYE